MSSSTSDNSPTSPIDIVRILIPGGKVALSNLIGHKTTVDGGIIEDDKPKNLSTFRAMGPAISGGKDEGSANSTKGQGHRRTNSGGLFSKLSFLRSGHGEDALSKKGRKAEQETGNAQGQPNVGSSASSGVEQQTKTRKRKGSLRKTALLGTGRSHMDSRERKIHLQERHVDDRVIPEAPSLLEWRHESKVLSSPSSESIAASPASPASSEHYPSNTSLPLPKKQNVTGNEHRRIPTTTSPPLGETSTTDEEDALSISYRAPPSLAGAPSSKRRPSASSTSYFPTVPISPDRRHSSNSHRPKSPLSASPARSPDTPEEWDYSETEWWGWVVLLITWIVFVVGMGSCLGVWSWAWDVGETPYAPPELEDDPTLPIVGYYPALMILTIVMAWVWVVIAWIGMKYFKHAKISSDDT